MTQLQEIAEFDENWYVNSNEDEQEIFRNWLLSVLGRNVITVTFTKLNGEERVMECTLKPDVIPQVESKENTKLCTVWDVNQNSWRSFHFDRITNINYTLD